MKPHAFSVTRKWRKFMAVGCSHGALSDPTALQAVLRFKGAFKPDLTFHLGDAFDCTAFRSGAKGGKDESAPIKPDFQSGVTFLRHLRPDVYMMGNHEDRLWNLRTHPNAIVSELAADLVADIETTCDSMKCQVFPYKYKQHYALGNAKLMHGTIFSENCCRDMAELWQAPLVIFAHAHRAGLAKGRGFNNPTGICVGHLMAVELAEYAKPRKSTYAWSQGFAWGEWTDDRTVAWLHEQPQGQSEWVLPI